MKIFYFTATGNSLAVAKKLSGELISIPQVKGRQTFKDDVIGVVFPTYGCTVPPIVRKFLESMKLEADYTFAIATYGMDKGKVLQKAEEIAEKQGWHFDYTNAIKMLDNCQPQFDIAKEREKLPSLNIEKQIAAVRSDIEQRKKQTLKSGVVDALGTWLCVSVLSMDKEKYAKKFVKGYSVDNNCVKCGTCAKVCPMGNIRIGQTVRFSDNCALCQACIHACPKKAIHLNHERNTERWRNPDVSLAEIISANEQK